MNGPKVGYGPRSLRLIGVQTAALARRSLVAEWRQLFSVLPGLVFPLLMAAVYTRQCIDFHRMRTGHINDYLGRDSGPVSQHNARDPAIFLQNIGH